MTRLSLSLLGPFQATLDGQPITGLKATKERALLAYLAVEAHRSPKEHPRQILAWLLWPDKPERAALANLRNALANLRKAIASHDAQVRSATQESESPSFLQVTREAIWFDPASNHWLDVATFQSLVDTPAAEISHQHLQQAVDLYRGDFMQGFSVRGSAVFTEWSRLVRKELHAQALAALSNLAAYHEERGAYREAILCAERQVALEPWHESAHRRWMRVLALSGQRRLALTQYATCCQALADEFGVGPEAATTALYEQIRNGTLVARQHSSVRVQTRETDARDESPPGPVTAHLRPLDAGLDGERRTVTVVRADLHSTAGVWWGKEIADRALYALAAEATRFGSAVRRYGTDALVACFGTRGTHEDDPERAVLGALAMQTAFDTCLKESADKYRHGGTAGELRLLVTVYTSQMEVMATEEGDAGYAAMRDARTFAARVQASPETRSEAAPDLGQVWVCEATRRLVDPLFEWSPPLELSAGSSQQAVRAYGALGRKANLDKMRGLDGLSSPLIGRDAELEALLAAVERLQNGVGGIVTVVGETGLGKSRLVAKAHGLALSPDNPSPNLKWIEGRCLSYATRVPYWVWTDALHDLLGLEADAPSQVTANTLQKYVRALLPAQAEEVCPFLARMMALPLGSIAEARLRGIEGEGLQVLTFGALERLFECAAEQSPLVVVCEDLHWADDTSIDLLLHLLALTDRVPILWICVFRPETENDCWRVKEACARQHAHRHTDLWLDPLSVCESRELVGHLLETEDLSDALRSRILARAEGNPFYLEEILRSLIDDGIVAYDPLVERWQAVREARVEALPKTLRGLLAARIDRLPLAARQVLQLASVVGRDFSLRLLEALCTLSPTEGVQRVSRQNGKERGVRRLLDAHLVTLQRAQMVREQSRVPEATYTFQHQLTLEAAYDSLPPRKRRVLHRRVAQELERLYSEHGSSGRGEGQLGLLAHHWEHAGNIERALLFLRRAGERAAAQFANADAVSYLSRAIELAQGDPAARFALLLAREEVYSVQGAHQAQQRDLAALEETAGNDVQRAEVAWRRARCAEQGSDHRAAVTAAQRAVSLAQSAGDVESEALARLYWSKALTYLDQHQAAWQQCERALALVQGKQNRPLEATSVHGLGRILMLSRDYAESPAYLEQALDIWREVGDRRHQGIALASLSSACRRLEDYDQAKLYGEQALTLLRETGERREEGWALIELGRACFDSGEFAAAKTYWDQALPVFLRTGARRGEAWTYDHLAAIGWFTGDRVASQSYLEQSLSLFRQIRERRSETRILIKLGRCAHALGESAAGLACLQEALSLSRRTGHRYLAADALTSVGDLHLSLEQFSEAAAAYQQALSLRHSMSFQVHAVVPLAGLAEICLAQGDREQALAHVQEILDHAEMPSGFRYLWEPFPVFLTMVRVLHANADPRAAETLETAYRLLLKRADRIGSQEMRRGYLDGAPARQEIAALWEQRAQHA